MCLATCKIEGKSLIPIVYAWITFSGVVAALPTCWPRDEMRAALIVYVRL